jgi:hypothetical protein
LFYYARALTEQNYIEEARKAWGNLASKYPNKYQGKEGLALLARKQKDLDEELRLWRELK